MKSILFLLSAACGLSGAAFANDQMRDWVFASGEKKRAEIVAYYEPGKVVTLRLENQEELQLNESAFSPLDRAWILQWVEQDEEARAMVAQLGGWVTEHTSTGKYPTEYAVYRPVASLENENLPMLILFHPGGNGRREIYRYVEAAAATGLTVVSLDIFRNSSDLTVAEEMLERFKELLPQIEATVPHDPKRIYMGGVSGGAMRSFHYAAKIPRPWAGVLSIGGWFGGRKYDHLDYPAMRVAMVNGDKDHGANAYIEPDSKRLQDAGCVVSIHAFEGGHQLAPPSVQTKALRWLLSDEDSETALPRKPAPPDINQPRPVEVPSEPAKDIP